MISAAEARRISDPEHFEETRVELKLRKALNNRSEHMKVKMSVELADQMIQLGFTVVELDDYMYLVTWNDRVKGTNIYEQRIVPY